MCNVLWFSGLEISHVPFAGIDGFTGVGSSSDDASARMASRSSGAISRAGREDDSHQDGGVFRRLTGGLFCEDA